MTRAPLITPAFEAFVAPARRYPQIWRLLVGLVVLLGVYIAWPALMLVVAGLAVGWVEALAYAGGLAAAAEPGPVLVLLATFLGMAGGAVAAARLLHGRGAGTLIGRAPVVLRDFTAAVAVVVVVYAVLSVPWFLSWRPVPNLDLRLWLMLLPLSVAGVLVQTLAEEMVFRGYLMQQLAARFRSPLVWFLLPAVAFGLVHYDPQSHGANTWTVIAAITLFAVVAADLTRRTGSLGAAWGLHFANNTLAILVIGTPGSISGLALWVTPYRADDAAIGQMLLGDLLTVAAVWLLLGRILRR